MDTEYRGYAIAYNEDDSEFQTEHEDGRTIKHATLAGIKKAIDRIEDDPAEKPVKQPKQNVLQVELGGYSGELSDIIKSYKPVTVGAFGYLARRYGTPELRMWVYTGRYSKSKERVAVSDQYRTMYTLDTPENRATLDKAIKMREELATLIADHKEAIKAVMEPVARVKPAIALDKLPTWER